MTSIFVGSGAVLLPHSGQNLASFNRFEPQPLHVSDVEVPQEGQNLEGLSPNSTKQFKHFIGLSKTYDSEFKKILNQCEFKVLEA